MAFHEPRTGETRSNHLHPANKSLFCHWESVRGEAAAPARSKINLKQIADILPGVFILERSAEAQSYRCRLSGTGITDLWGTDMTGRDLREPAGKFERDVLARLFDGVFAGMDPFCARLRLFPVGSEPFIVEMLGLPVIDPSGQIQLLGATFSMPERRKQVAALRNLQITGTRVIATEHQRRGSEGRRARLVVIPGGR